jgi:hypothetical protein
LPNSIDIFLFLRMELSLLVAEGYRARGFWEKLRPVGCNVHECVVKKEKVTIFPCSTYDPNRFHKH